MSIHAIFDSPKNRFCLTPTSYHILKDRRLWRSRRNCHHRRRWWWTIPPGWSIHPLPSFCSCTRPRSDTWPCLVTPFTTVRSSYSSLLGVCVCVCACAVRSNQCLSFVCCKWQCRRITDKYILILHDAPFIHGWQDRTCSRPSLPRRVSVTNSSP
jgi:hypothetical protein